MSDNARFGVIVAVVAVVVGGVLWILLRGESSPAEVEPETAVRTDRAVEEEAPSMMETAEADTQTVVEEPGPGLRLASRTGREPRRQRPTGPGAIRGEVIWGAGGDPAADAEVVVEFQDWPRTADVPNREKVTWTTTTDFEGKFRIDRLPVSELPVAGSPRPGASLYTVIASKDGSVGMAHAEMTHDDQEGYVKLALEEAGFIAGRVVNEANEPVAEAFVFPEDGSEDRRIDGTALRAVTDEAGRFEVRYLPLGSWKLTVRAEGYAVQTTDYIPVDTEDAEVVLDTGGGVSGVVLMAAGGAPVSGTQVVMNPEHGRWNRHTATTDVEGKFRVDALAAGRYTIALEDEERVLVGQPPQVEVQHAKRVDDVELRVAVGGVVTGKVYDADTLEPIPGVRIQSIAGRGGPRRVAVSDANGYYRLSGLIEGNHTLRRRWMAGYLHGEDREDKTVVVSLGQQIDNMDFPVKKGLSVRGIVVDTEGNPIERASIRGQDSQGQGEGETTRSKADGRFELRGFSPNTTIMITTEHTKFAAEPVGPLSLGDAGLDDVRIVMEPGASIAGVVVDKTGKPQGNVFVNAQSQQRNAGDTTGADGQFKVEGLSAGTYSLMLRRNTSGVYQRERAAGEPITIAKGQAVTGVRLVLSDEQGLTISGRVVNSRREPVRNASVNVHSRSGTSSYGYAETGEDGRYEISGLDEGLHMVFVHHSSYSPQRLEEVAAGSRNVDFELEDQATVEGRVLDARSGRPITTFQLGQVSGIADRIQPFMSQNMTTFFDENGGYRLTNVNAGDVTVFGKADGYAPAMRSISGVRAGETVTGIDILLEVGASVEGVVLDPRGAPLPGAQVFSGEAPNDPWMREQSLGTTTDSNGRFTLTSLSPDITAIGAHHNQYAPINVPVELAAGRSVYVEIRMGTGGTVQGVVRIDGRPAADQYVSLHRSDDGQGHNARTDANGNYEIRGIAPGEYLVIAGIQTESGWGRSAHQTAAIESDMVTTVNFDIGGGTAAVEGLVTVDGQPLGEGHLSATVQTGSGIEQFNAQIEGDGYYRLEGLPAGTVTVHVSANLGGQWQSRSAQVEAADGRTVRRDIEFNAGARVTGTVSGHRAGERVIVFALRGTVEITSLSREAVTRFAGLQAGQTQAKPDGSFEFVGLEPGEYTFVVIAFGTGTMRIEGASFATSYVSVGTNGATVDVRLP